jgi:hypothetical protein
MCHTPLSEIVPKYTNEIVLVVGPKWTQTELAENYGIPLYISLEEMAALYPDITYFVRHEYSDEMLEVLKE